MASTSTTRISAFAAVALLSSAGILHAMPDPTQPRDAWLANPNIPYPVAFDVPGTPTVVDRAAIAPHPATPRTIVVPRVKAAPARGAVRHVDSVAGDDVMLAISFPAASASFGFSPGYAGLDVVDIDGDARAEVIAVAQGASAYWYVAEWAAPGLAIRHVSRGYPESIVDASVIAVGDEKRYVVATGGELFVHALPGGELLQTVTLPNNVRRARVADIDGDGILELVTLTGGSYYYYPPFDATLAVSDLATQAPRWQIPLFSARTWDFAIGNFLGDAAAEIALAGENGTIRSAATGSVLATLPANQYVDVAAGNFDADPDPELALMRDWYEIRFHDARQPAWSWTLDDVSDLDSVAAWDFDDDGRDELITGDGQWGAVCIHSSITHLLIHCIDNRQHGVGRIAAGDIDGVPGDEIVWGAGATSTGTDELALGRLGAMQQSWWAIDESASAPDAVVADVDADGQPEYVHATYASDSGYGSGRLHFVDPDLMRDEGVSPPLSDSIDWLGTGGLDVAQLDGDAALEVIVATGVGREPRLELYDGATHLRERVIVTPQDGPYGTPLHLPRAIDATGVVVRYGSTLRRIRLDNGAAAWTVPLPTGTTLNTLAVANVDDDADFEIVAVTPESTTVLNASTGATEWTLPVGGAGTLDRQRKQLILASGPQVRVYDLRQRTLVKSIPIDDATVAAWAADVVGRRFIAATTDDDTMLVIDFDSGAVVAATPMQRRDLFRNASAVPTRVSGQRLSFWGNSDYASHRVDVRIVFRPLFADGFD